MNETLDCTNCCIDAFKHQLCDCHGDFCTKYKSIGDENDFMQAVLMNRPSGEVDAVKEYERQVHNLEQGYITIGEFDERIEPLRHLCYGRPQGEWIEQEDDYHHYWECSECGMGVGLDDIRNYCPNCGAQMKGADDEID